MTRIKNIYIYIYIYYIKQALKIKFHNFNEKLQQKLNHVVNPC
jgi:hypothetical protein